MEPIPFSLHPSFIYYSLFRIVGFILYARFSALAASDRVMMKSRMTISFEISNCTLMRNICILKLQSLLIHLVLISNCITNSAKQL